MQEGALFDARRGRRLALALAVTAGFMVAEAVGGLLAGSLALLADAGHMFTDAAALALALAAWRLSRLPADTRRSYGYRRVQVVAALVNSLALLALVGWLVVEAIHRLVTPRDVDASLMLVIALLGAGANAMAAWLLHEGHEHDLNAGAAYLHVLSDLAGSAAAVVAAVVILATGWMRADPLLSLLVAALIARGAWGLLQRSMHILLEGSPESLDTNRLQAELPSGIPALADVHHVHAWSIGSNEIVVTLHARVRAGEDPQAALAAVKRLLAERYGVNHSTVQVEHEDCMDDGARCAPQGSPT
jgi:cobalt-zinc-cadmium efflux system protein